MSAIGGGGNIPVVPGGTATATPPGGTAPAAAPVTLQDPQLAAHAAALAPVLAGTSTLTLGASGAHVEAILDKLSVLSRGTVTRATTISRNQQTAIAQFQRQNGITASGNIDQATLAKIDELSRRAPGTAPTAPGRPVIGAPAATPTAPAAPTAPTAPTAPVAPTAPATGPDPLAGKMYMDSTTFASLPQFQWARDAVELESVMGVRGMDADNLVDAMRETNNAGRTLYQRLRRPDFANAFNVGYDGGGVDDMRWDNDSHAMRERMKFVGLTVEDGRYDANPDTGVREISVGTDKMDDTYYDTANFDLLKSGYSVRGRARWDTDTEIRRILVGVKANTVVDEFGIKRTDKTDIRNDGASAAEIAGLDKAVRTGKTNWNSREEPIKPLKGVYDALAAKGVLPDVGTHQDVLEMQPQAHVRSVRSRYHMNETEIDEIRELHNDGGLPKIQHARGLAEKALNDPQNTLNAQERAQVEALVASARELEAMPKFPTRKPTSHDELEADKKLSQDIDAKYHAFSQALDGARRAITNARDDSFEDEARLFVTWQKSADRALVNKGTFDPFLAKYDKMTEADMRAFNDYGSQQRQAGNRDFRDFTALDANGWKNLRPAILNETVRIHQRMIESSGSAANQLFFDEARAFYIPASRRHTSNFIIDTFDYSEYVKHADWESIPENQRTPANQIPKDKIYHATLVAESQIELGSEKEWLDRLKELQGQINTDRASLAMKWMTAGGRPGIDPANPASYGIALAAMSQLTDAQLEPEVAKINGYMRSQGSVLRPITVADLRRLDPALLTAANRDKAVRTDAAVERNLDGAKWVFDEYMNAQKFLSEAKGDRVLRGLRDAGGQNLTWQPTESSKGDLALKLVSGIR